MEARTVEEQKSKRNVPKLRFPEFEGNWETKKLAEICKFSKGKLISKNDIAIDGKIECIRYGELYTTYQEVIEKVQSRTNLNLADLVLSEYNDIIIPASGETREDIATASCVLKANVALGGDLNIIKTVENGVFLSFYLNCKRKNEIARFAQGISIMHLYGAQLKSLKLMLPDKNEQQKIAGFISVVDKKIQQLTRKKELLAQYKKGVMQKIFSREIRFKDENGNDYPDWEEKRLGEIGDFKNGLNKDKKDFGFGFPFVNLLDVFGKNCISKVDFGKVNANKNELSQYDLRKGDVLFIRSSVKRSGVGETVLVLEDLTETVFSGFLIRFRECRGLLDLNYKKYCFMHDSFRKELLSMATTSANTNINQESLASLKILIPSLSEQIRIADYLSSLENNINSINCKVYLTQQFKKGLLQQMFV